MFEYKVLTITIMKSIVFKSSGGFFRLLCPFSETFTYHYYYFMLNTVCCLFYFFCEGGMRVNLFKTYISSSKNVKKTKFSLQVWVLWRKMLWCLLTKLYHLPTHRWILWVSCGIDGSNCSIGTFSNFVFIQTLNVCDVEGLTQYHSF